MLASRAVAIRDTAWIDYLLTAVLGCLALYTIGQGIAQPGVGVICSAIYVLGTGVSFLIGIRVRATPVAALDGLVYGIAAFVALFGQPFLNQLLPADSFPPELRSAAIVTWLLSLGSFAAWRDATRLFQAVPAIALFGLVGVYDTYSNAPFLFFGYLLCLALMFGRAHARSMLLQATQSGFARIEEGVALSEGGADRDSVLRAMRRGPWRWMAGPEWAVASAGAVILVSLFGAPIVHESVKGVAANIHLNMPSRMQRVDVQPPPLTTESLKRIGMGPRHLSNREIAEADLSGKVRYLRTSIFDWYNNAGWYNLFDEGNEEAAGKVRLEELKTIVHPLRYTFNIQLVGITNGRNLPVPIEVESISDPPNGKIMSDGTASVPGQMIAGTAIEPATQPDASVPLENQASREPDQLKLIPGKLQYLTNTVTANCKTDLEKANAIMAAIADRAKYNLKAAEVPHEVDPVEYFLFTSHEGYCDLFASAMAVMARDAGLDARYAIGYLPSEGDKDSYGRYVVRESDAHAWAEIYFKGSGWVVFDATTLAQDITPGADTVGGKIGSIWLPVTLGLGALAALVYYGPRLGLRRSLTPASQQQRQLDRLYLRFARELGRRARMSKPASVTPDGWLAMTRDALGAAQVEAARLNAVFVTALYARHAVSEDQLLELRRALRVLRRVKG